MPFISNSCPRLPLAENVAVVSSGVSLLGSGQGVFIDSFAEVVRFNRAPTEGFESDVGSRTTLRVLNATAAMNQPSEWPNQPADFAAKLRNQRIFCISTHFLENVNRYDHLHPSNEIFVVHRPERRVPSAPPSIMPSAGLAFVMMCLRAGIVPHLFGFGVDGEYRRGHYWEPPTPAGGCHDFPAENAVLRKFRAQGRIQVFF